MYVKVVDTIPKELGSYALWLRLPASQTISVGRLGEFTFLAGDYIYLGSAHGSGGLRARLGRHLCGAGKRHWHIDYLRAVANVRGFSYLGITGAAHILPVECQWSQALTAHSGVSIPATGFGASDCESGCEAHLVWGKFKGKELLEWLAINTKSRLIILSQ